MASYKIIVPDTHVLQRVCGTNDSNLKLIETALGTSVFACGNELSVDTEKPDVTERFRFIIDRMLDEIADGTTELTDCDLVQSILNTGKATGSKTAFKGDSISIPGGTKKVFPRTQGQARLIAAMRTNDMVFATGPAGSGKTFLAVAQALSLVLSHKASSIILTRPVVEAGESLGFLPGDLQEKINPYVRPLFDAMNALLPKETVRKMIEGGIVEIAPLAYMRGRTLNESIIILDEAQNTTREQMKMFLTRMGENSKVFITGDVTQIDLPAKVPSGLLDALTLLRKVPGGIQGLSIVELSADDVVRNPLVKKIIQAYGNE